MAKVTIEAKAFSDVRMKQLCRKLQIVPREAIGILVTLWHDSQEQLMIEASAEHIDAWLGFSDSHAVRVREALIDCGYLYLTDDSGLYRINGNYKKVTKAKLRTKSAKTAAKARWKSLEKTDAVSMRSACDSHAIRIGSEQNQVLDISPKPTKSKPKPVNSKKATPAHEFIKAYCDEYKARYGSNPVINGKAAGIAKRVVKDIGLPKAIRMIQTYVAMNDSWFVTRAHNLITFEDNLDKVARMMETGTSTSAGQARRAELVSDNAQVAENFLKRFRG